MKAPSVRMQVSEAVVYAELEDEAVLLNAESGLYFGLDAIGTRIWKLLEQRASEETIIARLYEEFDVSMDQLRQDVAAFLRLLEAKGLVSAVEE
jgi:hypothetical protein